MRACDRAIFYSTDEETEPQKDCGYPRGSSSLYEAETVASKPLRTPGAASPRAGGAQLLWGFPAAEPAARWPWAEKALSVIIALHPSAVRRQRCQLSPGRSRRPAHLPLLRSDPIPGSQEEERPSGTLPYLHGEASNALLGGPAHYTQELQDPEVTMRDCGWLCPFPRRRHLMEASRY